MRLPPLLTPALPILLALLASCASHQAPEPTPAPAPAATPAPAPVVTTAPVSATDTTLATVSHEYRGAYTSGFEMSWFEPCDQPRDDRMWWVTLTGDALQQRDSLLARLAKSGRPRSDGLLVRWRGTISRRMPAGHMGRGTRYMLVTQVLDIRPLPGSGACGTV